MTTILIYC